MRSVAVTAEHVMRKRIGEPEHVDRARDGVIADKRVAAYGDAFRGACEHVLAFEP